MDSSIRPTCTERYLILQVLYAYHPTSDEKEELRQTQHTNVKNMNFHINAMRL